jgi:hypothetical protein
MPKIKIPKRHWSSSLKYSPKTTTRRVGNTTAYIGSIPQKTFKGKWLFVMRLRKSMKLNFKSY